MAQEILAAAKAEEKAPVAESSPAKEDAPAVESAPVEEKAPAAEDKQFVVQEASEVRLPGNGNLFVWKISWDS